jgi:hypothetical protein
MGNKRIRAVLAVLAVITTLLIAPTVAPGAAQADSGCGYMYDSHGTALFPQGPYWWANVNIARQTGGTRRVLDIEGPWDFDGAAAHIWDWYGGASQYWCMYMYGLHTWKLQNYRTKKCLDIEGPWTDNRTMVHQWDCGRAWDERSQFWEQQVAGTKSIPGVGTRTTYRFRNVYANKCLDVPNWSIDQGTKLWIYDCHDGENQQWY